MNAPLPAPGNFEVGTSIFGRQGYVYPVVLRLDAGGDGALRDAGQPTHRRPALRRRLWTPTSASPTRIKLGGRATLEHHRRPLQRVQQRDDPRAQPPGELRRVRHRRRTCCRRGSCASALGSASSLALVASFVDGPGALPPGPFAFSGGPSRHLECRRGAPEEAEAREQGALHAGAIDRGAVRRLAAPSRAAGSRVACGDGIAPSAAPNLLLVTIDTLRADHVGAYGADAGPDADASTRWPPAASRFEHAQSRGAAHRPLARDDPHRPLPARARRARQRRLLARPAPPDAGHAAQGGRAIARPPSSAPIRWPPPSDSGRASTPSARTSRRARSPARARSVRRTRSWTTPSAGSATPARRAVLRLDAPLRSARSLRSARALSRRSSPGRPYDGEIAFADAQLGRVFDWLRSSGHEQDTVVAVLVRSRRVARRARRGDPRRPRSTRRRCTSRFSSPGPGVPAGVDRARARRRPWTSRPRSCACSASTPPPAMTGRDLRPALAGRAAAARAALRGEPVRAPQLPLVVAARVDGRRLEAHRRQPDRALPPQRRPRRDARPRGGGRPARRAHARRPAGRGGQDGPGRRPGAHRRHHARPGGDAQEPRLRGRLRGRRRASTSPACPTRATACSSTSGCRSSCARRTSRSIARPRKRRRSRRQDPGNPFAQTTVASLAYRAGRLGRGRARLPPRARARSRSPRRAPELRQAPARHGPPGRLGEGAAPRPRADRRRAIGARARAWPRP